MQFTEVNKSLKIHADTLFIPYKLIYSERKTKSKKFVEIIFESDFKLDTVKLFNSEIALLNKVVTTDETIGIAHSEKLYLSKEVDFQFNNYPKINLDSILYYDYLYISKGLNSQTIIISFSSDIHYYK
jgi:hypothetical protein